MNDNILEKRLNNFKNKLNDKISLPSNPMFTAFTLLFTGIIFLFKALIFGYSIKLIFVTDWNWWQFICVGIAINFLLTYIYDLFRNK